MRSWVHSVSRRRVFRQGKRVGVGWRSLLRWWRVNHQLDQRLKCSGIPVFHLGYEELALAPEMALQRLCSWLEIDFDAAMLRPGMHSKSHILAGNRMRFEPGRSDAICYDGAWIASSALSLQLAPLLTPVARLNRRLVYSNGLLGSTWPRSNLISSLIGSVDYFKTAPYFHRLKLAATGRSHVSWFRRLYWQTVCRLISFPLISLLLCGVCGDEGQVVDSLQGWVDFCAAC